MERKKKMVGDRIRLGRMANALSLQELSEILAYSGHKLTRAAISNYEMGRAFPSEQILKAMSKELGLSESYFYKQEREGFGIRRFRAADLVMKHEMELRAYLQVMLEQFLEVDGLLGIRSAGAPPERVTVKIGEEEKVEELVDRLRREWGNAEQPIASVCGMLEDNGWYVFEMPDVFEEDQVSGVEESSGNLFIAYTIEDTVDETRYRILEEVGHAYLEGENPEHQKWLCKAFAHAYSSGPGIPGIRPGAHLYFFFRAVPGKAEVWHVQGEHPQALKCPGPVASGGGGKLRGPDEQAQLPQEDRFQTGRALFYGVSHKIPHEGAGGAQGGADLPGGSGLPSAQTVHADSALGYVCNTPEAKGGPGERLWCFRRTKKGHSSRYIAAGGCVLLFHWSGLFNPVPVFLE